jgi:hypothetical protein
MFRQAMLDLPLLILQAHSHTLRRVHAPARTCQHMRTHTHALTLTCPLPLSAPQDPGFEVAKALADANYYLKAQFLTVAPA